MIRYLIRLNYKYDDLKEPKRTLFFFLVLMPVICCSQLVFAHFFGNKGYIYWAILMLFIVFVRMTPTLYFLRHGKDFKEEENKK